MAVCLGVASPRWAPKQVYWNSACRGSLRCRGQHGAKKSELTPKNQNLEGGDASTAERPGHPRVAHTYTQHAEIWISTPSSTRFNLHRIPSLFTHTHTHTHTHRARTCVHATASQHCPDHAWIFVCVCVCVCVGGGGFTWSQAW